MVLTILFLLYLCVNYAYMSNYIGCFFEFSNVLPYHLILYFFLSDKPSILSINENSSNINQLVQDTLSQKNVGSQVHDVDNVLSYPLKEAREKFEKDYLSSQLKKHKGNISKTAEFVGMERSALHRKLKSLGIKGIN